MNIFSFELRFKHFVDTVAVYTEIQDIQNDSMMIVHVLPLATMHTFTIQYVTLATSHLQVFFSNVFSFVYETGAP